MKEKLQHFGAQVRMKNGEHEQLLLRIAFSALILCYLCIELRLGNPVGISGHQIAFSGIYLAFSIILATYVLFRPDASNRRVFLTMICDIGATTYGMFISHDTGPIFFGIYLWVIVGNGIRFGTWSLVTSYISSLIGFSLVILLNGYWISNPRLSLGLMLTLILIPPYILKLRNQLNAALEEARRASKAKSDFLSNMSHEMRTPLNGVIGASELLIGTRLDDEQRDLAATLKKSAQHLLKLIDNILDLSKIESGRLVSDKVDFDLHKLVSNTLEMFLPQAERKGIGLSVRITPETCFALQGDPLHLQQVLINLLGNAVKFTSKGNIELRVSSRKEDEGSIRLRFEVIDTGIGISPQAQARIFDSFTQADQSISRIYGGTGLGTTISKQLVELMGGKIGVHSEPGIGSIFWFEITFDKQPHAIRDQPSPTLGQLHVLTIGLSQNEQAAVANYAGSWGIHCEHAPSLAHLFTCIIDQGVARPKRSLAVLCQPQHIGLTVQDFAANIQELRGRRDLTLILINPDLHNHNENTYLDAGYSCLLRTPLDKTLLFNALHGITSSRPSEGVISFKEHYERSTLSKRGVRILVAEDNGTSRQIIEKILMHGNHKVDLVGNGEQALDKLKENTYDLLLLDMNMPQMGGLEVVKIHRARSRQPADTPVLILTANATPEARQECERAHIGAFLTKPVDALTLLETVSRLTLTPPKTSTLELAHAAHHREERESSGFINEETLHHLALLGGDQEEFLSTVIDGFLSETEKLLEAMRIAESRKEYATLKELAHILKGSAGNVGAATLYTVCRQILQMSDSEMATSAEALLHEALRNYPPTRTSLMRYLNGADQAIS